MKHNILLILIIVALAGCDPVGCADEIIQNDTEMDLKLFRISPRSDLGDTTSIEANAKKSIAKIRCAQGGVVLSYSAYDSVYITDINNVILKTYHPDDSGKNIFNVDDTNSWKVERSGKDDKKYIFEIAEEDISFSNE